ncbi:MAG: MBL fold metallo-hydrolase [bacterium]|nr:MBL fold metallo-hydrolase [bacterium]
MKITIIGWWGAYPSADEATSGYLLETEGFSVLLDCGSGVLAQLQKYIKLQDIDAVVLSHYHSDHVADIGCLQYAARILMDLGQRKQSLKIYGHAEDENFAALNYLQYSTGHAIDTRAGLQLGPLTFSFCRNIHPDPCFSMRIEEDGQVLTYVSDTGYTDDHVEFARKADLLLCESSLYDEYRGRIPGHLTAGEAGRIAEAAGAGHLVLTHLPHFGNHGLLVEQAGRQFIGTVELATTGQSWRL